jgi:hypothetical protein
MPLRRSTSMLSAGEISVVAYPSRIRREQQSLLYHKLARHATPKKGLCRLRRNLLAANWGVGHGIELHAMILHVVYSTLMAPLVSDDLAKRATEAEHHTTLVRPSEMP